MIKVTSLSGVKFYLNQDHIEKIEQVPETVLTLSNGKKYIVVETPEILIEEITEYKNKIFFLKLQEEGEK